MATIIQRTPQGKEQDSTTRTGLTRVDEEQLAQALSALSGYSVEECLAELRDVRKEDAA